MDPGELAGVTSTEPSSVQRYLRGLLEGADGELAARLLGLEDPPR